MNPKASEEDGMRDGYQCKMKEIFIAHEVSRDYSNVRVMVPARPLECVILRIVHHAHVIQTVKQTVQLF
jgi:hypothetical protein